jgi:hypothetical protein
MLEAGFAVVERDTAIKSLVDLHFGASEAETASLLGDLEAASFPLHDVVVADDAFVHETADALETFRSRAPGGCVFAGLLGERAVVVGDEFAQHGVGSVAVRSLGQTQFAGEAILPYAPETLDAGFGLRTVGGDEGDAELLQSATELRGLAFSRALLFERPDVVVADEDAAVIAVESQGHAEARQHETKQAQLAEGGFGEKELRGEDFSGGMVLHAEGGEARAASLEPVVGAAVELPEFAEPCRTHAALAISGSAAFSGGAQTVFAQHRAQCLAAEGQALALH